MPRARRLYHWTPDANVLSISRSGLEPDYATTRPKRIWVVESANVLWARQHVAKRHGVSPEDLSLLAFVPTTERWLLTSRVGCLCTDEMIHAARLLIRVGHRRDDFQPLLSYVARVTAGRPAQ